MKTFEFVSNCAEMAKNGQKFTKTFGNRYFSSNAGRVSFWLYDTCICSYSFKDKKLFINNGGYNTVTTRKAMNEFLQAMEIKVNVSCKNFIFLVNGQAPKNDRNIELKVA